MEAKKPWQSKTILLNALMGLIAIVAVFWPAANAATLFLSAHMAEIGVIWSVVAVALRFATKDKVQLVD